MRYAGVIILLVATWTTLPESEGAKILGLFNLNGRSHFVMFQSLLKGLAQKGHEVYVVGHFPQKKPIANYTDISVEGCLPVLVNNFTVDFVRDLGYVNLLDFIWKLTLDMCDTVLQQPNVQNLIASSDKFDLIITEIFGPDCFLGLAHKFKTPVISMISSVMLPWGNDRVGNPDNPSFIPNYFVPFTDEMNFFQRFMNTIVYMGTKLGSYYIGDLAMDELGRKYYGEDLPPLAELKKNTSLIFVNSHFSLNIPRPTVPGVIEVGGIHIQRGGKLPKDIEQFMNDAKHGVIYFSLGSLVRAETLPKETIDMLLKVFSKVPQRVLWKIEYSGQLPSNIMASKWLPQFEILSHPNTKVFITHGGLMGTQEGVYTGVPMIGIPLFADQELNIRNAMTKGVATLVHYESLSEQTITHALNTVLEDPSYQRNAKYLSQLFRDRPQTALETAIFWTEYVIRHHGAPHLKSAAVELPLYQYLLLDVVTAIVFLFVTISVIAYFAVRKVLTLLCGHKSKKVKKN
ncbi:hypothetical protein L9F63_007420 [Diploptera punctata]|uniref:UDP-glucuronosyltransferase n=1 Tax=Diploptera punctata TaxID=6984 RepID=A0AAD8E3Y0_DIPPU|nr:hypothetical protein L9F63_007420 [Diploptera punctata]